MKKFWYIAVLLVVTSCSCLYPQMPPQYLYVDESCGAAVPDYLSMIEVRDNCMIDTVEQTPTRGTWLTLVDNPVTTVLIQARDVSGNVANMMFTLTLLDTIPPEFIVTDSTLIMSNYEKINKMYDIADRMLARQDWAIMPSVYEKIGIPDSVADWDDYANNVLVTLTTPLHAFTGQGSRIHIFSEVGDTLYIR